MNEYEATIQINPTDDIKFILEESGCYESEIEMMKAGGTYDAFVKRVYDAIDWSHLFERIAQMENDAITAAIDKLSDSMNLLSQNTDFNALLAAMKTDIEAEYEKATGYAIDLDEDSGSDYEVGINVEDSAADGFCLASGYMYGADSNFDWGIFKVKSQKNNVAAKPYIGLDMNKFFRQKMLLIDLSAKVKDLGYDHLADELWGAIGVFDAVQDSAEGDGVFTAPEADEETGLFLDDFYNDVLEKILNADKKKEEK